MSFNIASEIERYMVSLVNAERTAVGLHELKIEQNLNQSAEDHSEWMLAADIFSHTGKDNSKHQERIREAGFDMSATWRTGENIALHSVDNDGSWRDEVQAMMRGLMNSPGHKANILRESFDYIGVGIELGEFTQDGKTYTVLMATQNFGATSGEVELDWETGTGRADRLIGNGEADLIRGGGGGDRLFGHGGDDRLFGQSGRDLLKGGVGDDELDGGSGSDRLYGEAGDDLLKGGGQNDRLYGQAGNDRLYGHRGNDDLVSGDGNDRLWGHQGNDRLKAGAGNDLAYGGSGSDRLYGDEGDDVLRGQDGHDELYGGDGNDRLIGHRGSDRINSGAGDDEMTGNSGADRFIFNRGHDNDRITDFQVNQDRILLDDDLWSGDLSVVEVVRRHAEVTEDGVLFDFGPDTLLLEGLTGTAGLADQIDLI